MSTSTQALITQEYHQTPEVAKFQLEQRMARLFAMSGLFADIKGQTEEQAIAQCWVKIGLGASMGFTPAESMQGIHLVKGTPAVGAQLRAARMQRSGYDWKVDQCDDKGCKLTIVFNGLTLGQVAYMIEDAQRAGLTGKDNWKADPSSMCFARAITRAQRRFAPGVLTLDLMSTEEAIDVTPPEPEIQRATNAKTEALAKRLKAAEQERPSEVKAREVNLEVKRDEAIFLVDANAPIDLGPNERRSSAVVRGTVEGDMF